MVPGYGKLSSIETLGCLFCRLCAMKNDKGLYTEALQFAGTREDSKETNHLSLFSELDC